MLTVIWNRLLAALAPATHKPLESYYPDLEESFVSAPAAPAVPAAPAAPPAPAMPLSPAAAAVATPRPGPSISIQNLSSIVHDAQVKAAIAAAQVQIDRDFKPLWGLGASLSFLNRNAAPPAHNWLLVILDTSDQAGALGYHSLTPAGLPVAKIFAKDDQKQGLSWTVTMTHELLEMLADPYLNTTIFVQDSPTTGSLFALETADPVEGDNCGYLIDNVLVTNFITPAYFQPNARKVKYDFRGVLSEPLSIAQGGYLNVFQVNPDTAGWTQQFSETGAGKRFLSKGDASRPQRRKPRVEGNASGES